jgi:hypothetical protein
MYPPDAVETRTYWQVGNGDPFNGGAFGYDSTWTLDGTVIGTCDTRPAGAADITEPDYAALEAAYLAAWDAGAIDGKAWLDGQLAAEQVVKNDAKAALMAGTPLTDAEAKIVTGGI